MHISELSPHNSRHVKRNSLFLGDVLSAQRCHPHECADVLDGADPQTRTQMRTWTRTQMAPMPTQQLATMLVTMLAAKERVTHARGCGRLRCEEDATVRRLVEEH